MRYRQWQVGRKRKEGDLFINGGRKEQRSMWGTKRVQGEKVVLLKRNGRKGKGPKGEKVKRKDCDGIR